MISRATSDFWTLYHALPAGVRRQARLAFLRFRDEPDYPSLRFKKLRGPDQFWSARFGDGYRAVCQRDGEIVTWLWIGSHQDFDKSF